MPTVSPCTCGCFLFADCRMRYGSVLLAWACSARGCADECDRHADHDDHCRICAEACRRCEQACRRVLDAIG